MFMPLERKSGSGMLCFEWGSVSFYSVPVAQVSSIVPYRSVLKKRKPIELPEDYWVKCQTNLLVARAGVVIIFYFFFDLR